MFVLGQQVISKKIGLPIYGTIIGLIIGRAYSIMYLEATGIESPLFKIWDRFYPGWQDKFVYSVFCKTPVKILSFEEFKEYHSDIHDIKLLMEAYKELGKYSIHSYPEEDLETFEETIYEEVK